MPVAAAVIHAVKGRAEHAAHDPAKTATAIAEEPEVARTAIGEYQWKVEQFMNRLQVQIFVAALIGGNFFTNMVEKQFDPRGVKYTDVFGGFELFYNICFTIELGLNMFALWPFRFWRSAWNVFDFVVVTIGLLTTFKVPLPGPFAMLRMMRAFRVFRLFKRVKSLNKIITSLFKAVPGMINALFILLLVLCIYAILAVDFFMHYGKDGEFVNEHNATVSLQTARGQDWGKEYYGNFLKSLYTMFQVMTGESWSEAVARPLLHGNDMVMTFGASCYFISFYLVNAVVLINVVVAVLLEKMVDDGSGGAPAQEAERSTAEILDGMTLAALKKEFPEGSLLGSQLRKWAENAATIVQRGNDGEKYTSEANNLDFGSEEPTSFSDMGMLVDDVANLKAEMAAIMAPLKNIAEAIGSEPGQNKATSPSASTLTVPGQPSTPTNSNGTPQEPMTCPPPMPPVVPEEALPPPPDARLPMQPDNNVS